MDFFTCPKCGGLLRQREEGASLACPAGHAYDVAAAGYVNLLLANQKHSKDPGDSPEMVRARRDFLETGAYAPFSEKLCELAAGELRRLSEGPRQAGRTGRPAVLLDAGCGEGYYTGHLAEYLPAHGIDARIFGFDIGKTAVRYAAKRCRAVSFAAASAFSIPCAERAADGLIDLFAPIVPAEFARVVRPGGFMLLAVPGPRHLYALKQQLYERPYENESREIDYPGFRRCGRERVSFSLRLSRKQDILNLFRMTPYYWKTPAEGRRRLEELDTLATEACFDFLTFRREE